jgi:adenylate cyclase
MHWAPLPCLDFEGFTLDLSRGCLRRGLSEVKLRPKSFEVLRYLVENQGRLVSKDELMRAVWADAFVTGNSLVQCLIEIRRGLGDQTQTIIRTVPRRGYIFDVRVTSSKDLHTRPEPTGGTVNTAAPQRSSSPALDRRSHAPAAFEDLKHSHPRRKYGPRLVILLGVIAIAIVVSLALLETVHVRARLPQPDAPSEVRSIAVLPLANLSSDPGQEYFADGLTESLVTDLGKISALRVSTRERKSRFRILPES